MCQELNMAAPSDRALTERACVQRTRRSTSAGAGHRDAFDGTQGCVRAHCNTAPGKWPGIFGAPVCDRQHIACRTQQGNNFHHSFRIGVLRFIESRFGAVRGCARHVRPLLAALVIFCGFIFNAENLLAAESSTDASERFNVQAYVIQGKTLLSTNILAPLFAQDTGTNLSLGQILETAADLQREYQSAGYFTMNIVIAPKHITNGIVTLDVFPGAVAQILVSGNRFLVSSKGVEAAPLEIAGWVVGTPVPAAILPAPPEQTPPITPVPSRTAPNAGPRFAVEKYLVLGNTVLPAEVIGRALTNTTGAFGTNVGLDGIRSAATAVQGAYRARGYLTVAVSLPPQKLTNATVKIQVTEGRLASIEVKGNRYFSSNNVMRSVPGLHTNMILNALTFQAELNQANNNQDRQIYPVIGPGPDPGTSDLTLKVKDQLPVHAKVDLDNENSPGTPDLRVNASAVYDNLWQQEQSLGLQYSFSPERFKKGPQWDFYDQPLVANYSGFYRIPLGGPENFDDIMAAHPGSFGYSEATRKFNLPPASGQPDLTFFSSRSTIDTGLNSTYSGSVGTNNPGTSAFENDVQEDLTVNNDLGFRLSVPFASPELHSSFSGGFDFKTYQISSFKTNNFLVTQTNYNSLGLPELPPVASTIASPVPATVRSMQYLPLALRYDGNWRDGLGEATIGLGLSANLWFSSVGSSIGATNTQNMYYRGESSLQQITGSTKSTGHWVALTPSFSHTFEFITNWPMTFKADGQWATEPLIANEQFGAGGVNSVRGYHEGEVFGDTGWHVSLEQETAPHVVGYVNGSTPITIRGSIYSDLAEVYLLDPQGRAPDTSLWGAGIGGVASVGPHWEARFLFSLPLLSAGSVEAYEPFFDFSLTAQF
jgi:hemolysin activation/secretion protein